MLLWARGHDWRYLSVFSVAKSSGLEEVWIGEGSVGLPWSVLILDVEMAEIITEHARISVVPGTTLVIVIFARAARLRRCLFAVAV